MSKADSADLIIKLYDLRREPKMREARDWFITAFFPESAREIMDTILDPETSAKYRMVVSYWDMAASFVNHGAIDEEMFIDVAGESFVVFSKVYPHLEDLREMTGRPQLLANLEQLVMRQPGAEEMLTQQLEAMKNYMAMAAERSANSGG